MAIGSDVDNTSVRPPAQYIPNAEAKDLYAKHVAQAWTDQQASSDSFDNNLLTFSSGALGLSIAFIKDIVPLDRADWMGCLYLSWVAFAVCILVTIASFQIAARANAAHTKVLADYYRRGDESALERTNRWSVALPWCSLMGGAFLLIGITSTLLFAAHNVSHFKEAKDVRAAQLQSHR
jgi:hypothetical protein